MEKIEVDVLIYGGGVAGLWLLESLRNKNYSCLLIEKESLGDGQTIVSQGIIHGGVKYSLPGVFREDSIEEIKGMPERWNQLLRGESNPNLSNVKISSHDCYLWISKGLMGKLKSMFAGNGLSILNTKPEKIGRGEAPIWLEESASTIYRVKEPVIDTTSLLKELSKHNLDRIIYSNQENMNIDFEKDNVKSICFYDLNLKIYPGTVILTAGKGNKGLAKKMGIEEEIMQEKKLRQILVKNNIPKFYGHCIDHGVPQMTITSHSNHNGYIWNVGGRIAEDGDKIDKSLLIKNAREKLIKSLRGLDFSRSEIYTFDAVKSEMITKNNERPGSVGIYNKGNVYVGSPTKLALTPILIERLEERLPRSEIREKPIPNLIKEMKIAKTPWENL